MWEKFKADAEACYRRQDGTPTGEAFNIAVAFAHVLELHGATPPGEFGPSMLRSVRNAMAAGGKLCVNSINARVRRIRHVFKWAAAREFVPGTVWHALQAVEAVAPGRSKAEASEPVAPVPEADYKKVRDSLPPTLRAMVEFQYWTGARPGEVCRLRLKDIDTGSTLNELVWIYRPEQHKNKHRNKPRNILIGPRAQAVLAPFMGHGRKMDAYLFTPLETLRQRAAAARKAYKPEGADYRQWPSYQARAERQAAPKRIRPSWTTHSYAQAIRDACTAACVTPWSPNRLRHNFGTRIRKGYGLDASQVAMGHAHAETSEIYAEADIAKARKAMERAG